MRSSDFEQRLKERNTVIDLNQVKMVPTNPIIPCSLYTFEVDEPEKVEGRSTEGRLALALAKMRVPSQVASGAERGRHPVQLVRHAARLRLTSIL